VVNEDHCFPVMLADAAGAAFKVQSSNPEPGMLNLDLGAWNNADRL